MPTRSYPFFLFRPFHVFPLGFILFLNVKTRINIMFKAFAKDLSRTIVNGIDTKCMNQGSYTKTTILKSTMEAFRYFHDVKRQFNILHSTSIFVTATRERWCKETITKKNLIRCSRTIQ